MIKLNELLDPDTVRLTETQKLALVAIFNASTPELAFDITSGSQNLVNARNTLRLFGMIKIGNNRIILTNNGMQTLIANNLVDAYNQLTDDAKELIDTMEATKFKFSESMEIFKKILNVV